MVWHLPVLGLLLRLSGGTPPTAPRTAYTFAALAYGPVGGARGIALEQVEEHMEQLRAGGFVPITLQDVDDLLYAGEPVPERAVLLTFDAPRTRSWRALSQVLRSQGFQATAFIPTGRANARADAPPNRYLLRLARAERRWTLGPLGPHGPTEIPVTADGQTGPFFTARKWLASEARHESLRTYQARILNDQRSALNAIVNRVGAAPIAYAYPQGSFGQDSGDSTLRNLIRLGTTTRQFRLGFTTGSLAYNGRESDAARLNRLRVDPEWSGTTLLEHLDTLHASLPLYQDPRGRQQAYPWIIDREGLTVMDGYRQLTHHADRPPTRLWLSGSASFQDGELDMTVRPDHGTLHWWLRTTPDDQYGLHVQWQHNGTLTLHAVEEASRRLLAQTTASREAGRTQRLRFYLRGPFFQMERDDQPLFAEPMRVPEGWTPGAIGIGIHQDTADTPAGARLDQLVFRAGTERIAVWDAATPTARAIHNLHQQAHRFAVISPPANSLLPENDPRGAIRNVYRKLAHWQRALLIPVAQITAGPQLFQHTPPLAWAEGMARLDGDGVYIRIQDHAATPLSDLESWMEQVTERLRPTGKRILLQLVDTRRAPHDLALLAAAAPDVQWATTPAQLANGFPIDAALIEETPPTTTTEEWLLYNELHPSPVRDAQRAQQRQAEALAAAGHAAYRAGDYEQAIAAFSDWHALEPRNPDPLNFIADALERLSFRDEAVDFLQRSLTLDPGQIDHLKRLVSLLDALDRSEEARELLNRHALLFPDSADIQAAQAEWLLREQRHPEARTLLTRSLRNRPDHLPTALLLLQIADRPDERMLAMRTIMRVGADPRQHELLVAAARDHDLLTLPHTTELRDLLQRIATETDQPRLREMIAALSPRTVAIEETYGDRPLSGYWEPEGALTQPTRAGVRLQADAGQSVFSLRLSGSQHWLDSFVEARLQSGVGHFWLVARRTRQQMIRFGYDESIRRLRLQYWETEGAQRVLANERTLDWSLPENEPVTLRLEVRGKGARAYLDGHPLWSAPLLLPGTMPGGRITLDGEATAPGQARWELQAVTAGPLMAGIARLPTADETVDEQWIERLQGARHFLTDLSPEWFNKTAGGRWTSQPVEDQALIRTFANFHGLRLMPMVTVDDLDSLTAGELRSMITLHDLDGLILRCPTLPAPETLTRFAQQPETQGLTLIWAAFDDAAPQAGQLYGMGTARALNPEQAQPASLQRIDWDALPERPARLTKHTLIDDLHPPSHDPLIEQDANE